MRFAAGRSPDPAVDCISLASDERQQTVAITEPEPLIVVGCYARDAIG